MVVVVLATAAMKAEVSVVRVSGMAEVELGENQ